MDVYLDQKDWINLAKALVGHPDGSSYQAALDAAREVALEGSVDFPLSSVHYTETWGIGNASRRSNVARIMVGLSRLRAIAPPHVLVPSEIDRALQTRTGQPSEPRQTDVFGFGVLHALGMDAPAHVPLVGQGRADRALFEYAALADQGAPSQSKYQANTERYAAGVEHAEAEARLNAELHSEGLTESGVRSGFAAQTCLTLLPWLLEALERAGLPMQYPVSEGLEEVIAFVDALPSQRILATLRRLRHQNPQQPWHRTDLADLRALSIAIVHCDVVIPDRAWAHFVRRGGLGEEFDCQVLSSVTELPSALMAS